MFYETFISCLFKYNFKLLTARNFFYTQKKRLLMLAYRVEVFAFPEIFLQKITSSIQFYLFVHLHLNLTNHFFAIP